MTGHHMKQLQCFWSFSAPKEDEKGQTEERKGKEKEKGKEWENTYSSLHQIAGRW